MRPLIDSYLMQWPSSAQDPVLDEGGDDNYNDNDDDDVTLHPSFQRLHAHSAQDVTILSPDTNTPSCSQSQRGLEPAELNDTFDR
jgi:hypothetical protein